MGLRDMQEARVGDKPKLRMVGSDTNSRTPDRLEWRRGGGRTVSSEHHRRRGNRLARPVHDVEQRDRGNFSRVVGKGCRRTHGVNE